MPRPAGAEAANRPKADPLEGSWKASFMSLSTIPFERQLVPAPEEPTGTQRKQWTQFEDDTVPTTSRPPHSLFSCDCGCTQLIS